MADLGDFDDYQAGANTFSVMGKQYRAPLLGAATALFLKRVNIRSHKTGETFDDARAALVAEEGLEDPLDGLTLEEAMLGRPLLAQLIADGVVGEVVERAAWGILVGSLSNDEELARKAARGEDPNGWSPTNRAERRAQERRTGKSRTGGDAATRSTADTSGTTSRQRSHGSGRGRGSRGRRS